jgi:phosphatidate cytidylyltransferase
LSPRKTLEGLVTGFCALVFAVTILAVSAQNWSFASCAALIVVVALSAVLGDLAASWVKRRAMLKDYPVLLAGQGGLLDMLDSWLIAAPSTVATFVYFGL